MILVYYRFYISLTHQMDFPLICIRRAIYTQRHTKIERLVRQCITPSPQKIYKITKRLPTVDKVEQYFPGFTSFLNSTTKQQQIPRSAYNRKHEAY
jgi:hypothetical protein